MIEVREVTKRYGNKEVLKQVSFEIKEKEIFALLGPNGSGNV
jgi:ABC-type multidrug transport system ATPase subunit